MGCTPELTEERGEEPTEEDGEEETNSTEECECEQGDGTVFSRWDLLRGDKFFNKTVSVELVEELKQAWDILSKFDLSCSYYRLLFSFVNGIESQEIYSFYRQVCFLLFIQFTLYTISDCPVFIYLNIIILSGDFEGATVTERFITHFKLFHNGKTCDE